MSSGTGRPRPIGSGLRGDYNYFNLLHNMKNDMAYQPQKTNRRVLVPRKDAGDEPSKQERNEAL